MKNLKYISLLLATAGVFLAAPVAHAQVTATATITLTVVAAPGINFAPSTAMSAQTAAAPVGGVSRSAAAPGINFRSPGNVLVQLNSGNVSPVKYNLGEGEVKTFSAHQLKHVSSVEIVYLGS